jgi:hypothetical protein
MKRVKVTDNDLFASIGAAMLFMTVFLVVWFVGFPLRAGFTPNPVQINEEAQQLVITVLQGCDAANYEIFNMLLLISFIISLIYGAYICFTIRNVKDSGSVQGVNESREIAMAMYNILVLGNKKLTYLFIP